MTTAEVAAKLVALCRKGEFNQAMESLYGQNIVSVEAFEMPNLGREIRGLEGVRKKSQWWEANHTVESCTVTGPFVSTERFAVVFALSGSEKSNGKKFQMTEIAVYTVADGKIVREEFLYEAPPAK